MLRTAVLVSVLLFSLWPNAGQVVVPATADTVDVHDGAFAGHPAGVLVMNQPCVYGDRYHYELSSEGELSVRGPIICGSNSKNFGGGEEICYLNPQLSCLSRTGFSAGAGAPYAINVSGLQVGNKTVPWINSQQAIALMPSIKSRAEAKCDTVLFWQAKEKERNKPTSITSQMEAQEACKVTLAQLCASSGGKLANGKDISILCRP